MNKIHDVLDRYADWLYKRHDSVPPLIGILSLLLGIYVVVGACIDGNFWLVPGGMALIAVFPATLWADFHAIDRHYDHFLGGAECARRNKR